jgi:PAS domain S-box-containing protein
LIEIERHVNRGATFILVYSILGGFYLFLSSALGSFLSSSQFNTPFINTIVVLVLSSLFFPLRIRIQRFVDRMFYGGWYDYRMGLLQITQGLEKITELQLLAKTLAQRLVDTFRLAETCVFLSSNTGEFSIIEVVSPFNLEEESHPSYPALPRTSLTYLLKIGVIERKNLQRELAQVTLSPEELELLNSEQIHLWVPVIGYGRVLGLLALGPKLGGDVFSSEDLDILRSVVIQIGPIIENIYLYTRLREHADALEKRVEERTAELHDAKERVEAILGSVGDGVIVTDLERRITIVNTAFEKQSGYLAAEIVGRNLFFLVAEDNDPAKLQEMQATLLRGEVWSGELLNQHKEGSQYDVQFTIAPVRDQGGRIVSYVGSQLDITKQKELEQMKDVFVADVSHELRTPIANIILYLHLLEEGPPEKRPHYLSVFKEQSLLLNKMVEDILDLSRLARGKSKRIEFSELDLNLLVEQVITAHRSMADAANTKLVFEPCQDLPPIWGDQNQIVHMIGNLVNNAVHYTPEGSVWVRTTESNGQVCLEVQDTGIGIENQDLEHIFERFHRGRNAKKHRIHGTGLGLAIVKEVVEFHNGKIEVESKYGEGSVFRVWLPIRNLVSYQETLNS